MKTSFIRITPDIAKEYLKTNKSNRDISTRWVASLADQMRRGLWREETAEPIKVNIAGDLIDGQHRLMALIAANMTFTFLVAFEIPMDVFAVIDQGKKRNVGDIMHIAGVENGQKLGEIVRAVHAINTGMRSRVGYTGLTSQEVYMTIMGDIESYRESLNFAKRIYDKSNVGYVNMYAAMHYILKKKHRVECEKFLTDVAIGVNITSTKSPAYLLRQRLIYEKSKTVSKLNPIVKYALYIKAWNAYLAGRELRTLKFTMESEEHPMLVN